MRLQVCGGSCPSQTLRRPCGSCSAFFFYPPLQLSPNSFINNIHFYIVRPDVGLL